LIVCSQKVDPHKIHSKNLSFTSQKVVTLILEKVPAHPVSPAERSEERSIKYLQELARRVDLGIRRFPKVLWDHSVEEFLLLVVKTSRPEPDTAHFPQGDWNIRYRDVSSTRSRNFGCVLTRSWRSCWT
jgi:hypothetical protein